MSGNINNCYQQDIRVHSILIYFPHDVRHIGEEILHTMLCSNNIIYRDDDYRLVVNGRSYYHTNIIELIFYLLYPTDDRL